MLDLKVGDTITNKKEGNDFREHKILAIVENLTAIEFDDKITWHTIARWEKWGFTLKQPNWSPKEDEEYYYIDDLGELCFEKFEDVYDKYRLSIGNCFPYTEEGKQQAKQYREKLINLNK